MAKDNPTEAAGSCTHESLNRYKQDANWIEELRLVD